MANRQTVVTAEIATAYLRENVELLEALAIDASDAEALEAEPLKQGEHNANFTFTHPRTHAKLVLRVNYVSQMGLDDQIGYEFRALRFLQPSGRVPCARYRDSSKQLCGHGALVMDFHEGEWIDYEQPGQVAEAARMLADVHAVPVGVNCPLIRPGDPLKAQVETCKGFFENYRRSSQAEPGVVAAIERMLRLTLQAMETPLQPSDCAHALNTEAVAAHFLIPEGVRGGTLVDWEKPIVGEVAQDVAYFLSPTTTIWDTDYVFSRAERERFLETYWRQVNGRFAPGWFERRFDAYVKSNCLVGITWSANAWVEYHDPTRPLKNEKTFNKLQVYLSLDFLEQCFAICFARPLRT